MKQWAKYEVGFIDHGKFKAITANAICLWIEGKNYADGKFTDGLLPDYEVKRWRFYSKKSVELLTTSCGIKPGTDAPYAALWDVVDGFGFKMHDYLEHNDCRDAALERIEQAQRDRARDKEYKRQARAAKKAQRDADEAARLAAVRSDNAQNPSDIRSDKTGQNADRPVSSGSIQNTEYRHTYIPTPVVGVFSETQEDRVRTFVERYPAIYAKAKHGASYRVLMARDNPAIFDLVLQWPDVEYLCKMLELFLRDKQFAPMNQPGSPRQFAAKASECDSILRANGIRPEAVAV